MFIGNPFPWCVEKLASFSALVGYTPLVWAGISPGDAMLRAGFDALPLPPRVLLLPSTSSSVCTAIFGFSQVTGFVTLLITSVQFCCALVLSREQDIRAMRSAVVTPATPSPVRRRSE
jgi:hypothetical protein